MSCTTLYWPLPNTPILVAALLIQTDTIPVDIVLWLSLWSCSIFWNDLLVFYIRPSTTWIGLQICVSQLLVKVLGIQIEFYERESYMVLPEHRWTENKILLGDMWEKNDRINKYIGTFAAIGIQKLEKNTTGVFIQIGFQLKLLYTNRHIQQFQTWRICAFRIFTKFVPFFQTVLSFFCLLLLIFYWLIQMLFKEPQGHWLIIHASVDV